MQVVVGEFSTQEQAETALLRLREAGYSDGQMALVSNARAGETVETPATGAVVATTEAEPAVTVEAGQGLVARDVALAHAVPRPAEADRPVGVADEERRAPGDPATPPQLPPSSPDSDRTVEDTALGSAVGAIAGGAIAGPVGIAVGAVAGGAIAAWLKNRGDATAVQRSRYAGPYLLAVEVDGPAGEVHSLMNAAGATEVHSEPL